jgi:hypothetical protein
MSVGIFRSGRAALAAFVLSVLVLAGCGSSSNLLAAGSDALDVPAAPTPAFLAQAADRTVALETGRIEGEVQGQGLTARVSGSFDAGARSAALQVSVDAEGETHSADVVLTGDEVFVRPDGAMGDLGEAFGTPWLKVGLDDLAAVVPGPVEVPTIDPAELIERLRAEGIDVAEVGRESVRGIEATHYRATVPAGTASPELGGATVDVWVDDAGLIRRLDVRSDDGVTARIELFELGEPVSIEAPPADQVTDLGDLGELLGELPR